MVPSASVRSIARRPCEQATTRPWPSSVRPLVNSTPSACTVRPSVPSSQRRIRFPGMSLKMQARSAGSQTGPSAHVLPVPRRSRTAPSGTRAAPRGSRTWGWEVGWFGEDSCVTGVSLVTARHAGPRWLGLEHVYG